MNMSNFIKRQIISALCGCFFLILSTIGFAQGLQLYRYTNNQGVTVISSQIPPHYVSKGYEVITYDGRVLETVAPEPIGEEKIRTLQKQEQQRRQEARDAELLKRYSHADDIEAAKQRRLAQNRNVTAITERNIEKIDAEINRYQALAAADEREGREVSTETLKAIEELRNDREKELQEIAEQQREGRAITDKYDSDIARFKIIRP
jgi:hypothetical protein